MPKTLEELMRDLAVELHDKAEKYYADSGYCECYEDADMLQNKAVAYQEASEMITSTLTAFSLSKKSTPSAAS